MEMLEKNKAKKEKPVKKEKSVKEKPVKEKPARKEKPVKEKPVRKEKPVKQEKMIKENGKKVNTGSGKAEQNRKHNMILSIRNKIIVCFLVPIIFMIVIGVAAYKNSEEGLNDSFRSATTQTINMAEQHVDLIFSLVESEAQKYVRDSDLGKYFIRFYDSDPGAKGKFVQEMRSSMGVVRENNEFVRNIHIIPMSGVNLISTAYGGAADGFLESYRKSEGGSLIETDNWIDGHPLVDETVVVNADEYVMAYQVLVSTKLGAVLVDVDTAQIQAFLDLLDLGDGSIVGFVTKGGKELVSEHVAEGGASVLTKGEKVFYGQSFFPEPGGQPTGADEVDYKGTSYQYIYKVNERTGAVICALIPVELITAKADEIKGLTVGLVALACVVVLAVGLLIVVGIQNNMNRISKGFGVVSKGDLTVQVKAKGRDEFRELAGSANEMISNTKNLVRKVTDATGQLEESAQAVGQVSDIISDYSTDIMQAISEINDGMSKQSEHAQECVNKTDRLSAEIQEASRVVEEVEKLVDETENMINRGMEIVQLLGERARESNDITRKVGESIDSLRQESEIINTFVGTITEISEQTNLLSLNASIEAARAGESGRGFAVVAEEIRKLADDSATAAGEISNNVAHITAQTLNSVESARNAQAMVEAQTESVDQVVSVFREMQQRMGQLIYGLKNIVDSTEKADHERKYTVEAVKSISDIIEETANSAEVVREVVDKLMENVRNLNHTADVLGENMDGLVAEVSVFKV